MLILSLFLIKCFFPDINNHNRELAGMNWLKLGFNWSGMKRMEKEQGAPRMGQMLAAAFRANRIYLYALALCCGRMEECTQVKDWLTNAEWIPGWSCSRQSDTNDKWRQLWHERCWRRLAKGQRLRPVGGASEHFAIYNRQKLKRNLSTCISSGWGFALQRGKNKTKNIHLCAHTPLCTRQWERYCHLL